MGLEICDYECGECQNAWLAPYIKALPRCPRCHSNQTTLRADSVRLDKTTRV